MGGAVFRRNTEFTGDSFHSDTNAFYKVCFVKH